MKYDHKQSVLTLSSYSITAFDESGDSLSIGPVGDIGAYTIGAGGRGVFVSTGNESGTLTLKLLQHSPDNAFLSNQYNLQVNSLKAFTPIEMYFKDTINGDEAVGTRGYFTTRPTTARGTSHNATTWTITFEKVTTQYAEGLN
ncbi:hypothetical protein SME13J_02700 [Serratia marcescens]|nr:hypothetical protein SME13J_02700 [Serratia marcescens]